MQPINILVTLDGKYLPVLGPMLKSLFLNNLGEMFHVYLIHQGLCEEKLAPARELCRRHLASLLPLEAPEELFADAPTPFHYSKAMYYRLLAHKILPRDLDRVLYLDPDVLVINSIRTLYDMDVTRHLFAAAAHTGLVDVTTYINNVRLGTPSAQSYYNSGVLLMNLRKHRKAVSADDIFACVKKRGSELLLPDQDVLNILYGSDILPLDDSLYNFDVRRYGEHFLKSEGEKDMDWMMRNTVVLHFCGKNKPWNKGYRGRFGLLYKHYQRLAER